MHTSWVEGMTCVSRGRRIGDSQEMTAAQQLLSTLRDKFQGNPFVHSLWLAPLIITLFYYIGVGMKTVERSHDEWVARQNARNAAESSRKEQ